MMVSVFHTVVAPAKSSGAKPIGLFTQFVEALESKGTRYCHWKSNFHLLRALGQDGDANLLLSGELDFDLLVDRRDSARFESVLALLGFKRTLDPVNPHSPAVLHFYGLDVATGALLHLHVYYRIVTGGSLLKNYSLPLEELLLSNIWKVDGLPLAHPKVELIIFIIRMMVKYGLITGQLLLFRDKQDPRLELEWLLADGSQEATEELLERWLPSLPPRLFQECVSALRSGASRLRCYRLGRRLSRALSSYRRFSRLGEVVRRAVLIWKRGVWRLVHRSGSRNDLASGGAVIAFSGLDVSGQSTLLRETASWLGKVFRVDKHDLGKPPSAWLTLLANLARHLAAWATPHLRMSARQNTGAGRARSEGLLCRLRMVMLAWDRRALAARLHRKSADGWIVLCDHYSPAEMGAIDDATLERPLAGAGGGVKSYLARLESRLYRQIAPPDIVIRFVAPAAVAVERNHQRREPGKEKSDNYAAYNQCHVGLPSFPGARTVELNTNCSHAEMVQDLRRILWQLL